MENLKEKIENSQKVMRVLKISEIRYLIGYTNKGPIELKVVYGENTHQYLLDSTPIEQEVSKMLDKHLKIK